MKFSERASKKTPNDYQKQMGRLLKKASDIDANNLAWLKKQLSQHGFPKVSEIGRASADEWFLLLLHADRDKAFQKKCLDLMKQLPDEWGETYVTRLELRASSPPAPTITLKPSAASSGIQASTNSK